MIFKISERFFDIFPQAKIGGIFLYGINNQESENIRRILREYSKSFEGENERLLNSKITAWDSIFSQLNIDPKSTLPAHKSLLTRGIKSGSIPDINSIVNVCNYISLKYTIPVGSHDLDKSGNIEIGMTEDIKKFKPINSEQSEFLTNNEWAYLSNDKQIILTRNLVWRQGDQDKISADTKKIFIPLDDPVNNFTNEQLEKIAEEIYSIIKTELGCEKAVFGIANKFNNTIDSSTLPDLKFNNSIPSIVLNKRMDVVVDESKIDEVLTKGIKDIFPGRDTLKQLMMSGKRLTLYTGIDPTANFIHMGHMIWMKKLKQFQDLGHEVTFLIGGFTAMIGDPDKKYSRQPLTKEQVRANFENYKNDASKILDFDNENNPVRIVNNYDWLSPLNLESWLQVMGNVTLQHILSHDMFKQRLENETPIRLHEIMYPLMQGYDSVAMGIDLEIGGSDQTFNMLTGRILERNMLGREKFVVTLKLLTDNSGNKMGKTTNNAISFKDSPSDVYGKVMSFSDSILPLAFELLSDKAMSEITLINEAIQRNPMDVKKGLAFELTKLIHGEEEAKSAGTYFEKTIQNNEIPENIPEIDGNELGGKSIIDILEFSKLVDTRGEGKRLVKQGGVKINGEKVSDPNTLYNLKSGDIIQSGKRNWVKIK